MVLPVFALKLKLILARRVSGPRNCLAQLKTYWPDFMCGILNITLVFTFAVSHLSSKILERKWNSNTNIIY